MYIVEYIIFISIQLLIYFPNMSLCSRFFTSKHFEGPEKHDMDLYFCFSAGDSCYMKNFDFEKDQRLS